MAAPSARPALLRLRPPPRGVLAPSGPGRAPGGDRRRPRLQLLAGAPDPEPPYAREARHPYALRVAVAARRPDDRPPPPPRRPHRRVQRVHHRQGACALPAARRPLHDDLQRRRHPPRAARAGGGRAASPAERRARLTGERTARPRGRSGARRRRGPGRPAHHSRRGVAGAVRVRGEGVAGSARARPGPVLRRQLPRAASRADVGRGRRTRRVRRQDPARRDASLLRRRGRLCLPVHLRGLPDSSDRGDGRRAPGRRQQGRRRRRERRRRADGSADRARGRTSARGRHPAARADPSLRRSFGAAGRRRAEELYSWPSIVVAVETAFAGLL